MLVNPQLGFTYDCPHCMQSAGGALDLFVLRAQEAALSCTCGGSQLHAFIRDNVLTVRYPCALCGKTHEAAFVPDRPLSGTLCALECPESGLPTGYVSTPRQIDYISGEDSEKLLSDFILQYFGIDPEDKAPVSDKLSSAPLKCSCGSRSFSASIRGGVMRVRCRNCGHVTVLPTESGE